MSGGDVAPFLGHNAVLRWSAIQDISYSDEDEYEKFWSESCVSEDFDMALRLQMSGFTVRMASYMGDGFKEGVSLNVFDELNRWSKYAYGCNELLFNPLAQWIFRGPFTPLIRKFLRSRIPVTSKISILAYIGTYYAIGGAWITTLLNFFLYGWFKGSQYLSNYYLDSFRIYFSLVIVFTALGNVSLAIFRYRLGEATLIRACKLLDSSPRPLLTSAAVVENFKWIPLFTVFLCWRSFHVSRALLAHMFSINMTWEATSKEVDRSTTFAQEWWKALKTFRVTFAYVFLVGIMMIVVAYVLPADWQIRDFVVIYPLTIQIVCHFLLPVALNPRLMMMQW